MPAMNNLYHVSVCIGYELAKELRVEREAWWKFFQTFCLNLTTFRHVCSSICITRSWSNHMQKSINISKIIMGVQCSLFLTYSIFNKRVNLLSTHKWFEIPLEKLPPEYHLHKTKCYTTSWCIQCINTTTFQPFWIQSIYLPCNANSRLNVTYLP